MLHMGSSQLSTLFLLHKDDDILNLSIVIGTSFFFLERRQGMQLDAYMSVHVLDKAPIVVGKAF